MTYRTVQISNVERDMIVTGLNMRRAYIETGDCCTTAQSAQNIGKGEMVKTLTTDQMRLIIATEELVQKLYR